MIPNPAAALSAVLLLAALLAGGCSRWESGATGCPGPLEERSCVRPGSGSEEDERPAGTGMGTGTGTGTGAGAGAGAGTGGEGDTGERAVLVGEVVNARDLGGIPLADDAEVAAGLLFRGPPLAALSADGCDQLAELGVRTVIDLRIDSERASKPSAACAQEQAAIVLAPLPIPYSVSPDDYLADLYTSESIVEAFRALGDADAYPIYFHCTFGRDRTAVLAAVILLALGADRDAIMDDYLLSGATVGAYPQSLAAVLDEVQAQGGIDSFLASAGVAGEWIETLRTTAVPAP
jgi:protein-tyrosine phosphatase